MSETSGKKHSHIAPAPGHTRRKWLFALTVFTIGMLLYINTIPNGYSMDDVFVTSENELVQKGIKAIPEIFTTPYVTIDNAHSDYRPLVKVSYAIEHQFFNGNPHISHGIQAFLYGLVCMCLFLLLAALFPTYNLLLFFTAAILFAAHPLHTEVVAGLKNRDELLSFLFSMGVIYCTTKGFRKQKFVYYVITITLLICALLSKTSSIILVLWVPLLLYYSQPDKKWPVLLLTGIAVFGMVLITNFIVRNWLIPGAIDGLTRPINFTENPLALHQDITLRIGTALNSLGFYLQKCILPHQLGWFYGYNTIPVEKPWALMPAFYFTIHIGLFGWALYGLRNRSLYSLAILLYLTGIAPFINITGLLPGIVAERVAFFATAGFCLLLALGISKLDGLSASTTKPKLAFTSAFTVVLMLYSFKTLSRNTDWKDNLTLYGADAEYLDQSAIAHEKYGIVLQKAFLYSDNPPRDAWMLEKAMKHYKRATEIYLGSADSWARIGEILSADYNRPAEALPYFEKAMQLRPGYYRFHFDIAYCYELLGKYDTAIKNYHEAMRLDPSYTDAWQNLSVLYSKAGKQDSAIKYNQVLLQRNPNSEHGNANLGYFYKKLNDTANATIYFKRALQINPNRADVRAELDSLSR